MGAAAEANVVVLAFDEDFHALPEEAGEAAVGGFFEKVVEAVPAGGFGFFGNVVFNEFRGGGAGALRIAGDVGVFEADFLKEVVGVLEFFFGFAAEADDDIGGDGDIGNFAAKFFNDVAVLGGGVSAVHAAQSGIVAGLDGQV